MYQIIRYFKIIYHKQLNQYLLNIKLLSIYKKKKYNFIEQAFININIYNI